MGFFNDAAARWNAAGGFDGLAQDPLFMVGMGLLSDRKNPTRGAVGGLLSAQQFKLTSEQEKRAKKEYDLRMAELEAATRTRAEQDARNKWSYGLLTPESAQKYSTPEGQKELRRLAETHGNPEILERGGLLQPLQQQYAPPEIVKLMEIANNPATPPQDREIIRQYIQSKAQSGGQAQTPASLLELDALGRMTPEEKANFWRVKRGNEVISVGGVPHVLNSDGEYVPYATAAEVAGNKATIAGAEAEAAASGQVVGERTATAALDAPKALSSSEYMVKLLDDLKAHPGKSYAVGKSSVLPVIPGTPAADFVVRLEQIGGKQFLEAFESLKGGGQITQVEGEKATQAIARMQRAQTEEEFDASVDEFRGIVEQAARRAQAAARGAGAQRWQRAMEGGTPSRLRYNPATGEFE